MSTRMSSAFRWECGLFGPFKPCNYFFLFPRSCRSPSKSSTLGRPGLNPLSPLPGGTHENRQRCTYSMASTIIPLLSKNL